MKKLILLVAFAFIGTSVVSAQTKSVVKTTTKTEVKTTKKKGKKATIAKIEAPIAVETVKTIQVEGPGIVFDNEVIDYGTIEHNADGNRQFVFTNNGTKPLIISSTQGSCGCTVPTKPEGEIAPGAKGVIGVKYATDRVGPFEKTVTVTSNAEGKGTVVVKIKGTVLPDATPAAVEMPKS